MLENLKRNVYEANMQLASYGLAPLTFGNVSAVDRKKGILAIKPSGVSYGKLRVRDMVLVDLKGEKVEGKLNPSSDTPTHVRLYNAFSAIGAVVHTHSKFATAFAQAERCINCYGTTHADFFHGPIPVTRRMRKREISGGQYEWETGSVIAERFKNLDPGHIPGVLVANHGPFAWATSAEKAVETAMAVEIMAEMALMTESCKPSVRPIAPALLDKHFFRKHGAGAYYGQSGARRAGR